ncbi:MAG: D-glycerate dehydrogenase [Pseudomonadales bacterium]
MTDRLKVILTRRWPAAVETRLAAVCDVRVNDDDHPFSSAELRQALETADVLGCTVTDRLDAAVLGAGCRVKLLANFGVGFNHIDMKAAQAADIQVSNTPGVLTDATADIAMTLLLMCARRAGEGERLLRAGAWSGWSPTSLLGTQVSGKTLGIVGMGRIGVATARRAAFGFNMKIRYHSRRRLEPVEEAVLGAEWHGDLVSLLASSDFVSLHCPSTAETQHLLDAKMLACLPQRAFLINTARGDIIDEAALAEALANGRLAGAGLDVYEREPVVHPGLLELDNVVLLPHQGSGSRETREAMGHCAVDNIEAFMTGQELPNRVST